MLKAMIAAVKADGHVDATEMDNIRQQMEGLALDGDVNDMILAELVKPLDAAGIAALAGNDVAVATEIYLVSAAVIDAANEAEQAYLAELRAALKLVVG